MVSVQMLLLPAQRRDVGCLSVGSPNLVAPLGLFTSTFSPEVVLPDGEPLLKECASHTKLTTDGPGQQVGQLLPFFGSEVHGLMKEQGPGQP